MNTKIQRQSINYTILSLSSSIGGGFCAFCEFRELGALCEFRGFSGGGPMGGEFRLLLKLLLLILLLLLFSMLFK